MKLNIPLHKRIHQLFCKHKSMGWSAYTRGINNKEGYEYVSYECIDCGMSIGEWHEKGEWEKLDFPEEYTIQNTRVRKSKMDRYIGVNNYAAVMVHNLCVFGLTGFIFYLTHSVWPLLILFCLYKTETTHERKER